MNNINFYLDCRVKPDNDGRGNFVRIPDSRIGVRDRLVRNDGGLDPGVSLSWV